MAINTNVIFTLNPEESPKNHKLKSIEWAIITQVNGKNTTSEIAKTLSLTDEEVKIYFSRLIELKLIKILEDNEVVEYIDPEVIKGIEDELVVLVGPVASIILDDILLDMNKTRETLEKSQIGFFVELIKDEIDDEEKKMKFLEIVLPKINSL